VVAIAPRHLLICDLVGDIVAAVQAGAVREAGADTAACIIVFVRQRAPSEVGFSYQLSGFVIGESVTFAFGVNDFSQASEFIVPACQAFAVGAGQLTGVQDGTFSVRFTVDGGAMVYRVHTDTEDNPFVGGLFSQFELPDTLY